MTALPASGLPNGELPASGCLTLDCRLRRQSRWVLGSKGALGQTIHQAHEGVVIFGKLRRGRPAPDLAPFSHVIDRHPDHERDGALTGSYALRSFDDSFGVRVVHDSQRILGA